MLLEAKPFRIDPPQQQRLRDLSQRVLDVVEEWKGKQTQRMSAQGASTDAILHQLRRYVHSQRGGKMLIGTVSGLDNSCKRERTYKVLLSSQENVSGYFDDEFSAADMLELKNTALKSGEAYACKKYRVGVETVRRAVRIPEDILMNVPARYMGKGEIVLTFSVLKQQATLPQIADTLTHEFTHATQYYKEQSPEYNDVLKKIHADKELTPEEWSTYMNEPAEFEAQLRGLVEHIEMRYQELSDPKSITSIMTETEIYKKTRLFGEEGVDALLQQNKQQYIKQLVDNFLHANVESCQYINAHMNVIRNKMNSLINLCKTGKFKHASACVEYRQLKSRYYFANHEYGRFVCAASTSPTHWRRLKLVLTHCINNLPK